MTTWYTSITTKLTVAFLVLIVLIAGLELGWVAGGAERALETTTQDELCALACVIATQIDGDALAGLSPGDEGTPEFLAIRDQLYAMEQSHDDILYLYTMRKVGDGVAFVVDADYGHDDDVAGINEVYETPSEEMILGFEYPVAETGFTEDRWGVVMSGYAPIRDSSGAVVGIVGVDMHSERILERLHFIENSLYAVILAAILAAAGVVALFSRTVIRDVRALEETARRISTGDMDVELTVERNDEIGDLAESFGRMVASLKILLLEHSGRR